jgi:hypothetical protein
MSKKFVITSMIVFLTNLTSCNRRPVERQYTPGLGEIPYSNQVFQPTH